MSIEKLDFETIEHENVNYVVIHRKVIQEIKDHFAFSIWAYLQSLPSNWQINRSHLKKHFSIGDDKLKKHLAYLKKMNLIEYIQSRQGNRISKITIRVLNGTKFPFNSTSGVVLTPEEISTGVIFNPVENQGALLLPPLKDIDKEIQSEIKKKQIVSHDYEETYFPVVKEKSVHLKSKDVLTQNPHNIPQEMIDDWLINRKAKKCPLTQTAWQQLNEQLTKCDNPIESFQEMVGRGWISLKAEWITKKTKQSHFDNESTEWINRINEDIF